MYPTIPVHAPLTFTLADSRDRRSLAQCIYRIDPPEWRDYKGTPSDAAAALARRLESFAAIDPVVPVKAPQKQSGPICPETLDLRNPPPSPTFCPETREPLS